MLSLANKYKKDISESLGYDNVTFYKGKIQNLKLNLKELDNYIIENKINNSYDYDNLIEHIRNMEQNHPMIKDNSIDVVISNCVLNLVSVNEKEQLFKEIYRVIKDGGKAIISDIVSNKMVPEEMRNDPELWSGCYSGAIEENEFIKCFEEAGFYGIEIDKRESTWTTINDIEFRSMTITAYKGKEGPCIDKKQSVIYKGPFKHIQDDDNHIYERGEQTFVCEKTYNILQKSPYNGLFVYIDGNNSINIEESCCTSSCDC